MARQLALDFLHSSMSVVCRRPVRASTPFFGVDGQDGTDLGVTALWPQVPTGWRQSNLSNRKENFDSVGAPQLASKLHMSYEWLL